MPARIDDSDRPDVPCPKCGGPSAWIRRSRRRRGGRTRWGCRHCGFRSTDPARLRPVDHPTDLPESRRYLVTAVQNATPVHRKFLASLKVYAEERGARIVGIPLRYRNPTSVWTVRDEDHDWWADEMQPYLFAGREAINRNLTLLGDIRVVPTAVQPLTGFDSITGGQSGIIGHPKVQMRMVPTPQHKLPKIMLTTGAVTEPNYTDTKAGKKGQFHHTIGATLVEVRDERVFHLRQINALQDGTFVDLDRKYTPQGSKKVARAAALIMGDTHVDFVDEQVVEATFGAGGIVPTLRPQALVWHDLLDFYSRSHHHRRDPFLQVVKEAAGRGNVMAEVRRACEFVDRHTPRGTRNVLVPSNHHDHLYRWMRETDWRTDPENAEVYLETALEIVRGAKMAESGAKIPDPFLYWARRLLRCASRTLFLDRDQSYTIRGIEVGMHGDVGSHGSRGTAKAFSRIGVRSVVGHSHTPAIEEGCFQAGTSSRLDLEYSTGPSGWLQDHVVIYSNGKRSHLSVIDGRWRLEDT